MSSSGADVTVGCLEVPRAEATGFGVMHVDENERIIDFVEKPADPPPMPGKPDVALASMGIYVFNTRLPVRPAATATPPIRHSSHDFGKDIIPYLVKNGTRRRASLLAPPACARRSERRAYWRDVGTIDAYWAANIDLTDVVPELDLYDRDWPIWTYRGDHAAGQVRPRRGRAGAAWR